MNDFQKLLRLRRGTSWTLNKLPGEAFWRGCETWVEPLVKSRRNRKESASIPVRVGREGCQIVRLRNSGCAPEADEPPGVVGGAPPGSMPPGASGGGGGGGLTGLGLLGGAIALLTSGHNDNSDSSPAQGALLVTSLLTLPPLKRVGFLALRMTLKSTILAAMLKPFNRAIAPIDELNLVNPRESISPSVLGYEPSVQTCPVLRFRTNKKYSVLWWWEDVLTQSFTEGNPPPRLSACYP